MAQAVRPGLSRKFSLLLFSLRNSLGLDKYYTGLPSTLAFFTGSAPRLLNNFVSCVNQEHGTNTVMNLYCLVLNKIAVFTLRNMERVECVVHGIL